MSYALFKDFYISVGPKFALTLALSYNISLAQCQLWENVLRGKELNMIPLGYTYDANGNVLTFKDSTGYWSEYTYDTNGNVLTCKRSTGYWYEYTYDANGKELTYKNSNGLSRGFSAMSTQEKVLAKIKTLEKRFAERKGA